MPRRHMGGPHKAQAPKKHIAGIVEVTRKGTGYMSWPIDSAQGKEQKEDIEIFPEKLNGALNGDQVEVEILSLFPRPRGRVKKIVARAKTEFVCTVKGGQVLADDQRFNEPIQVGSTPADGTKVLVELIR